MSGLHRALNHALISSSPLHNEFFWTGYELTLLAYEAAPDFNERVQAIRGKNGLVVDPVTRCTAQGGPAAAPTRPQPPPSAGARQSGTADRRRTAATSRGAAHGCRGGRGSPAGAGRRPPFLHGGAPANQALVWLMLALLVVDQKDPQQHAHLLEGLFSCTGFPLVKVSAFLP